MLISPRKQASRRKEQPGCFLRSTSALSEALFFPHAEETAKKLVQLFSQSKSLLLPAQALRGYFLRKQNRKKTEKPGPTLSLRMRKKSPLFIFKFTPLNSETREK
jgi:hypothetical protein